MAIDYTLKNKKGYVLDDDQNEIVEALLKNDFYFNCAQTGFGKTLTTITAAVHKAVERKEDDIHFVLIVPQSAVKAFKDTISGMLGLSLNMHTATLTRATISARFHVFNYSSIGSEVLTINGTDLGTNSHFEALKQLRKKHKNLWLICDEAHHLQDPTTTQYKIIEQIRPLFIGIWFLTATPILNNIDGFYYMTELVRPKFLASNIYSFRNKYCQFSTSEFWIKKYGRAMKQEKKEVSGYKDLDILKDKFSQISIIKAKTYDYRFYYKEALLSPEAIKYYKYASAGLFSGALVSKPSKTSKTSKITKTKKKKQNNSAARLHDLQRVVSNSHKEFKFLLDPEMITEKELLLVNTIKEVIKNNEAVLIYFSYKETMERVKYILNKIKDRLNIPDIFEIHGTVDPAKRKLIEDSIKPRDVVLITSAGTESVNLQRANNLIFYEIPFPLREFIQACGRIARTNSKFNIFNVYILEAAGTIDTYKKNRILSYMNVIKTILGNKNSLPVETLILSEADKAAMKDELLWWG